MESFTVLRTREFRGYEWTGAQQFSTLLYDVELIRREIPYLIDVTAQPAYLH